MAKNKKLVKKYYAIKVGRGVKDKIVSTWEECKKYTYGYHSVFKAFITLGEAEEFLRYVNVEKVREQATFVIEKEKIIKATTSLVQARVPKGLYTEFQVKCNEYGWETDKGLIKLIEEWVN